MAEWADGMVGANGINIHYHRTGGAKPPMLLLHGITDNGLCWTRVAENLQDRYDIVMTDARGHGQSDRLSDKFTVPVLAADAAGVIRGLGLDRPIVFGHSMGAITAAAALAADYPDLVRAVILEDPPLRDSFTPPPPEFVTTFKTQLAALRNLPPDARPAVGAKLNPNWHAQETGAWAQSKAEADPRVGESFGTFDLYPWRDALARLRCPGLLITGDAEKAIVKPDVALEAMRLWNGGEVAHIEGAGHNIRRDRFAETMAAVDAFLARLGD